MYRIFFRHSFVAGHLGCFHILATVNNEHWVHISFRIMVFFGYKTRRGIAGSNGALFLVLKGTSILLSIVVVPIYIPINSVGGFPFLRTLSSMYCL